MDYGSHLSVLAIVVYNHDRTDYLLGVLMSRVVETEYTFMDKVMTRFNISAKMLISTGALRITEKANEEAVIDSLKSCGMEMMSSPLVEYIESSIELDRGVLSVIGSFSVDRIESIIDSILVYRLNHVV